MFFLVKQRRKWDEELSRVLNASLLSRHGFLFINTVNYTCHINIEWVHCLFAPDVTLQKGGGVGGDGRGRGALKLNLFAEARLLFALVFSSNTITMVLRWCNHCKKETWHVPNNIITNYSVSNISIFLFKKHASFKCLFCIVIFFAHQSNVSETLHWSLTAVIHQLESVNH